jgi:hypothetical protein
MSLTSRKEHKFQVSENKGEPKIFESKKEEESEQSDFGIKRNLMIRADHSLLLGEFHLRSYDGPGMSLGWRDRNAYRIFRTNLLQNVQS